MSFITRTAPAVVVIVAIGVLGFLLAPAWTERRELASLPQARSGPNVLLIVLDTVRADAMSLYGYSRPTTPRIDAFAAKGTVFTRGISTSPWTLPSHGSLFTVISPTIAELFGTHSHGLLFGLVLFSGTLGGSTGPLLAGFLFDHTGTYQIVLIVLTLMAIFGLFLVTLLRPTSPALAQ